LYEKRNLTRIKKSCPLLTSRIFDLIVLFDAFNSLYFASEGLKRIFEDILIRVWMLVGFEGMIGDDRWRPEMDRVDRRSLGRFIWDL
jgi:hypothetical protein